MDLGLGAVDSSIGIGCLGIGDLGMGTRVAGLLSMDSNLGFGVGARANC